MAALVCLHCRARTERGRELHTLSPDGGGLICDNRACRRAYPVVDGIPVVVPDAARHLERFGIGVVERDLPAMTQGLLAGAGPDDAPYPRLVEHLSTYIEAHWADDAGMAAVADKLAERAAERVGSAVELGCSVGRGLYELARGAAHVVGIDVQLASLRRARRLLAGEPLEYARRMVGRCYEPARVEARPPVDAAFSFVCADAMDPPLVPGSFDRVVALNVLDAVSSPPHLVAVADALCAPGGELILASPYAWQSGIVAEEHRFGGADPAGDLRRRLVEGEALEARYTIEDEAELPWSLRRDSRSAVMYRVHWMRARKPR